MNFRGERTFADTGAVRLGDTDDGANGGGRNAGADGCASGGCAGRGDEGIGAVVDIEHGALRAFKHHALAGADGLVQQQCGVGHEGRDPIGDGGVLLIHLHGVDGVAVEESVGDGVLFLAGVLDMLLQQFLVEQVGDAEAAAGHFVLIGGSDAARSGADLFASGGVLRAELDHAVVGKDDVGAVADEQIGGWAACLRGPKPAIRRRAGFAPHASGRRDRGRRRCR